MVYGVRKQTPSHKISDRSQFVSIEKRVINKKKLQINNEVAQLVRAPAL